MSELELPPAEEIEIQIEAIEDQFLELLTAGEAVDPRVFAAAHPALEPWLSRRLALLGMAHLPQETPAANRANGGTPLPRHLGRFEIIGLLGQGAFGSVYKARDPQLDRWVAIKVPRVGSFSSHEEEERFFREARSAANLKHPGIVTLHEVGEDAGVPFLVSELIDGQTLAEAISERRLAPRESAELVAKIAAALDHAHSNGIVHRDVKPGNILLDAALEPHVTDFGLARKEEDEASAMTLEGQILGTPAYMSPEQAQGDRAKVGPRSDVYGLGALLYELLAGEPPFRGSRTRVIYQVIHEEPVPPARLQSDVPPDLETICLRAMAKEPSGRYTTAGELAEDLARFLHGEPIRARPVGRTERTWRWCRRNPMVASLLGFVALLLIGALIGSNVALVRIQNQTAATQEALESTRAQLARSAVRSGMEGTLPRDPSRALPWFVRALELSEGDPHHESMHRLRVGMALQRCAHLTQAVFHREEVVSAAFDREGARFVTASADGTALVVSVENGNLLTPPLEHSAPLTRASFSPDGAVIVTSCRDGAARLWSSTSGAKLGAPFEHAAAVLDAAFSPDGALVATASEDKTARLWNAKTGEAVHSPLAHRGAVVAVTFSPNGELILTASDDRFARVWEVATGKLLYRLKHGDKVRSALFSPDGGRIVTGSDDTQVRVWETATGKLSLEPLDHGRSVVRALFSLDGQHLVTANASSAEAGKPRIYDLSSAKMLAELLPTQGQLTDITVSPDGRLIASASGNGTVFIWDWKAGDHFSRIVQHGGAVTMVAFHPDGRRLLTASVDRAARLWDLASPVSRDLRLRHTKGIQTTVLSADERCVATASADHTALVWDARNGETLTPPLKHPGVVYAVAFSPDGDLLATGGGDGMARVWSIATGKLVLWALPQGGRVLQVLFSPDGAILAAGNDTGKVSLWDTKTGFSWRPPLDVDAKAYFLEFTPDRERFLAAGLNGNAVVVPLGEREAAPIQLRHGSRVWCAKFSPDGKLVATGGELGTIQVWDAVTGEAVGVKLRHPSTVSVVVFSRDQTGLAAGSFDGTTRIWDWRTGNPTSPTVLQDKMQTLALSPDGQFLAVSSPRASTSLWDPRTGERLTLPSGRGVYTRSLTFFSPRESNISRLLSCDSNGAAEIWELRPDDRPLAVLKPLVTALSARIIDSTESLVLAEPETIRAAWEELRAQNPPGLPVAKDRAAAWHLDQASASEILNNAWAVKFHLEQAGRLLPGDPRVEARRKRQAKALKGSK